MTVKKDAKFYLRLTLYFALAISIIAYSYLRTRDLVRGVSIVIYEPLNYSAFVQSAVEIKGKITKSTAVFLNDRKIFLDEEGNFKETVLLSPGYNIVTVRANDRFQRELQKKLELVNTTANETTQIDKASI